MSDTLLVVEDDPVVVETGEDEVEIRVDDSDVEVHVEPTAVDVVTDASDVAIMVDETPFMLVVSERGDPGPKGDPGDQGDPGVSGGSYTHEQVVPSATWTITHSLGYQPAVTVLNSDSPPRKVEGSPTYPSLNQVVIEFASPFAGTAILS